VAFLLHSHFIFVKDFSSKIIMLTMQKGTAKLKPAFYNVAHGYFAKDNTSEKKVDYIQTI
jgi:hypothetical protein